MNTIEQMLASKYYVQTNMKLLVTYSLEKIQEKFSLLYLTTDCFFYYILMGEGICIFSTKSGYLAKGSNLRQNIG